MEERYIKAIDPDKWVRPAGWPVLPNITSADNKFAGVYAIYENKTNRLAISHNSASSNNTIDWGDGTSTTWSGTALQIKTWNYSTIFAPVMKDDAGYNYKPILIQYQLNSGNIGTLQLSANIATAGQVVQSNWLDFLISWILLYTWQLRPQTLQRINVVRGPGNQNFSNAYTLLRGLRVLEGTIFGPGNTNSYTSLLNAFTGIGPVRLGDIEVNRVGTPISASGLFNGGFIRSVGNMTFNNVNSLASSFLSCRDLTEVGNITATAATTITDMFNACTNLRKIGLIDIGTSGTVTNVSTFANCVNLREIEFVSAVRLTVTTSMFSGCARLRKLRLPGMAITFSIADADMERDALVDLFTDLADLTSLPSQTITITNNPGVANLTVGDLAIATGKNWLVVTT